MTGKQLRNSILQWAIQGKLVPQDPNDEPASVLLKRIREEKTRLVKEKKIKKDKNESIIYRGEDNSYYEKFADGTVKCIDDEIPFDIPQGWEWCRIRNIFILNPKNDNKDEDLAAFIPMEMISACYGSSFTYKEVKWKSIKKGYTHFSNGDIAFAKITPCFQNRKSVVFENLPNGIGAGTTELRVLRPFGNSVNPYYLLFFLETPYFVEEASFKGTANQQRIISGYLEEKLFPLPPRSEQDKIVNQIQLLLPIIDRYEYAFETHLRLQDEINGLLRKSILQEAIQGRLVPQIESEGTAEELLEDIRAEKKRLVKEGKLKSSALKEESRIFKGEDNKYYENRNGKIVCIDDIIPFEIPAAWQWSRIGTILNIWSARRVHEKDWRSKGVPFYRAREIGRLADSGSVNNDLFIDKALYDEFSKSGIPKIGDLMMTAVGTLGKTYIVDSDFPFYFKDGSVLCVGNSYNLKSQYLKLFFNSNAFRNQYISESDGTTVATLTMVRMNNYLIPIPPLSEQARIVTKYNSLASIMSR